MARKRKRWRYTAGRRPFTVAVEEFEVGGNIYVRIWSRRDQTHRYRSLKHRDRERAIDCAERMAARLREEGEGVLAERVTVQRLFRLYREFRTPAKAATTQGEDERRIELFLRFLGTGKNPSMISRAEWERFIAQRTSGAIDPRGRAVAEAKRRTVRPRSVEADLRWLRAVIRWGTLWRLEGGGYLLKEDPTRGLDLPPDRNPRRPVVTQERYRALLSVADQVRMEVTWSEKPELIPAYLRDLLILANGTGRRISAICQLRYADLRLDDGPHGAMRWPADTDKQGKEWTIPMSRDVREVIDGILTNRPGLGRAPLFPAPSDPAKPIRYEIASDWLREAEKLAELETQDGTLWHGFRRKWASERKGMSVTDVAAAGGWSSPRTVTEIYQRPDRDTLLQVVMAGDNNLKSA